MSDFLDKVVIMTGASSGIGREASVLFAKQGAKVVLVARNKEKLAITQQECAAASQPDKVLVVPADVTKLEDLKRIVEETVNAFHKIDILVNNAGAANTESLLTGTPEGFENMINLNARAPFFLTQYCVPYLAETKGNVINISSVLALRGRPTHTTYGMAKAALDQLTRSASVELAEKGIRVNTINPAIIETNFSEAAGFPKERFQQNAQAFAASTPARRIGQAIDVAECILFLASKKAAFVDGINFIVDGGKTGSY